jgi:hypothetical protein
MDQNRSATSLFAADTFIDSWKESLCGTQLKGRRAEMRTRLDQAETRDGNLLQQYKCSRKSGHRTAGWLAGHTAVARETEDAVVCTPFASGQYHLVHLSVKTTILIHGRYGHALLVGIQENSIAVSSTLCMPRRSSVESMLGGSLGTTAWRVLWLQIEGRPPAMEVTIDSGWSSSLRVRHGTNNPSP